MAGPNAGSVVLTTVQSHHGGNPVTPRLHRVAPGGFDARMEEEMSADAETPLLLGGLSAGASTRDALV